MDDIGGKIVAVVAMIIGVAVLAVIVGKNAQTAGVISTAGQALSGVIGAAVQPVM